MPYFRPESLHRGLLPPPGLANGAARIRVVLKDPYMLNKYDEWLGLTKSWVLILPQHRIMEDLASHLLHIFDLSDSCPDGVSLSMDGFVFPPFESTSILKEGDIICVERLIATLSILWGDSSDSLEEDELVVNEPVHTSAKPPADEALEMARGCQVELQNGKQYEVTAASPPDNGSGLSINSKKIAAEKQLVPTNCNHAMNEEFKVDSSEPEDGECRDGSDSLEEDELVENEPVHTSSKPLADEEFEKARGCQSEIQNGKQHEFTAASPGDNGLSISKNSKKTAAAKQLMHTNHSHAANKESKEGSSEPEDGECFESMESLHRENVFTRSGCSKKRKAAKKMESSKRKKRCFPTKDTANDGHTEQLGSSHAAERNIKLKSNLNACAAQDMGLCDETDGFQKRPSRSARRKKAKRKWLRELAKHEKEAAMQNQSPGKEDHNITTHRQQSDQKSESGDEFVPVVIRPGHIRFEPIEKEQTVQPHQAPVEAFHWNGFSSKKKGQKWGTEKFPSSRSNENEDFNNPEWSDTPIPEEVTISKDLDSVEFDKLAPLVSSPKEGDVLAYRLLELSSSWTPELSPFRVGKTSFYDPEVNNIVLMPVPEYPIIRELGDDGDGSVLQPDTSFYREDGSLEIDFTSLVDVRIVKLGNSLPVRELVADGGDASNDKCVSNKAVPDAPVAENGEVKGWDEIRAALNEKKSQLSERKDSRGGLQARGVRGGVLGPLLAHLRSNNDL